MVGWSLVGWRPQPPRLKPFAASPSSDGGMPDAKRATFGATDDDVSKLEAALAKWNDAPGFLQYGVNPNNDKLTDGAIEELIKKSRFLHDIEELSPNMAIRESAAKSAFSRIAAHKERRGKHMGEDGGVGGG